jgi:hypothetical protein
MSWRLRLAVFAFASLSIASLLMYFLGVGRFRSLGPALLAIELAGLTAIAWLAPASRRLMVSGLCAGALATLAYDIVRVPLVHSDIPVFKAISYFGVLLLGADRPTTASEILGWGYHLSNGISFGLMYAAIARRPGAFSALAWGLSLEGIMLLTPYAEVFGYARDARFFAITIGSHAVFGLVLWLALRAYENAQTRRTVTSALSAFVGVPLVLAAIAADFRGLHAEKLGGAPPPYVGRHLYACWDSPEPDRVAALWILKRFVDPRAEVYFIGPFEKVRYGTPFDMPEAEVRRQSALSATEVLARKIALPRTDAMALLVRTTHLAEVSKWMLIADAEAGREVQFLRATVARTCGEKLREDCLPAIFEELDRRYGVTVR